MTYQQELQKELDKWLQPVMTEPTKTTDGEMNTYPIIFKYGVASPSGCYPPLTYTVDWGKVTEEPTCPPPDEEWEEWEDDEYLYKKIPIGALFQPQCEHQQGYFGAWAGGYVWENKSIASTYSEGEVIRWEK